MKPGSVKIISLKILGPWPLCPLGSSAYDVRESKFLGKLLYFFSMWIKLLGGRGVGNNKKSKEDW